MGKKYGPHNTYLSILDEKHCDIISTFKSTNTDQNDFLINDALEYSKLSLGVTYLLFDAVSDDLIAFITLGMGAIKLPELKEDWLHHGKKLKEYPKEFPRQFPALKIGQLATQATEEGKGAGTHMLLFAIRKAMTFRSEVGCAYLIADANPDKLEWYQRKGFTLLQRGSRALPVYFELPY